MQSLLKPAGAFLSRHGCTKFLIWSIAIFSLTALTIKDLVPLVDEYRNNNVAIQVGLVIDDTDFRPPQLVLTIPFYTPKDEALMVIARHLVNGTGNCSPCEKLKQVGWDVWNGTDLSQFGEDDIESLYVALSLKIVQKLYLSLESNLNPLSSEYSSWNSPIFSAAFNFIIWIQENDFYQVPTGPQAESQVLWDVIENLTSHPLLDSLYARLLQAFCHRLTFTKIVAENEYQQDGVRSMTCEDLVLNSSTPLAFESDSGLSIALPAQDTPQLAAYVFVQQNRIENGFWKRDSKERSFFVYLDPSMLYSVWHEPIFSSYIYEAVREGTSLTITATYGIQARTRDSRPGSTCHNETDTMTCFTKCTKLYQINKCSCIPFSLKQGLTFDPDLPHCTMAMYTKCNLSGTVPAEARNYCIAKCKNICEYTSFYFQFNHVSETSHHAGNESKFIFRIGPAATSFTEFVLTVKNTPEQFLSQMGGLLNFYLGFDGLTMFATVLIFVDYMKRYWTKRTADTVETTVGTQMSTLNSACTQTSASNPDERLESEVRRMKAEIEKQKKDIAILRGLIHRQQAQISTYFTSNELGYPGCVTASDLGCRKTSLGSDIQDEPHRHERTLQPAPHGRHQHSDTGATHSKLPVPVTVKFKSQSL